MMKRLLSLLLVLLLVGAMIPASYAAQTENPVLTAADYARVDAVFDRIDAVETVHLRNNSGETRTADAAQEIVLESDNYVEGSLVRNGNAFTWLTREGIRCTYNPRLREIRENMTPGEAGGDDGIYNEPVSTRGGWPAGNQVYLVGPYYGYDDAFTDQYKYEAKRIATALGDTDGYTLYSGKSVTVDKVAEAVSKGAVVIFDSHGTTDYERGDDYVTGATSSYLCLTSTTGLTTQDYNDGALYYSDGICINGATISNHMKSNSPGGFLWMALCLGMATDTLCNPLREKGVEVVYGYSQSVSFDGDYLFEQTFWENMCAGATVAEAVADMKKQWGNWDWSTKIASYYGYNDGYSTIGSARSNYSSFPVVVSDEDAHPGQRKGSFYGADSLQTVRSTYTLFSQYTVTARSSNTAQGTVSVSGNTVTAVPAEGFYAQGYTLVSGDADVTQKGNVFTVKAASDCVICINFAPKEMGTVTFAGADVPAQTGYLGDSMALPKAEAPEGFTFIGWMDQPLAADTKDKPMYYAGSFVPTASTTLYALYSYVEEGSSTGTGDYIKVTETPEDWSGEYVIVYEDGDCILDGSLTTFDKTSNFHSVTVTNGTITQQQADGYQFTVAKCAAGYSIQGASGYYIGNASNSNGLTTTSETMVNKLSLSANGDANIVGSGGAYLRFNNTSGQYRFRYYKSSTYQNQQPVALYRKDGSAGVTYYTSQCVTACNHTNSGVICPVCGVLDHAGNMNEDDALTDADAVYLLRHALFPSQFPIYRNGDFTADGYTSDADAVYLLCHILFPDKYPLS